jgi:phosphate starvation-inducible protein PhoH and related proteins
MTEITIFLEDVDPVVFFGPNNSQLDKIQGFFPKIKLLARGNELKCMGEESEITLFAEKFNEIIEYYRKYRRLEENDIEKYFLDADHMRSATNGHFEDVIVFGTSGKPIRARTVNQLQLVNDYKINDHN